jgi:hypothetical protein
MMESDQRRGEVSQLTGPAAAQDGELPYCVELWGAGRQSVERVLARAVNASLAHAIFKAAQNEHPGRRITLRHGNRVLAEHA